MTDRYILNGHEPMECHSLLEWAQWFETANRVVRQEEFNGVKISTVFLGLDHSFGGILPLLFETIIFGGDHSKYQTRCTTWGEAEKMHEIAVNLVNTRKTP